MAGNGWVGWDGAPAAWGACAVCCMRLQRPGLCAVQAHARDVQRGGGRGILAPTTAHNALQPGRCCRAGITAAGCAPRRLHTSPCPTHLSPQKENEGIAPP